MATRRRLTRTEEDRIIEAYHAWDPADTSLDALTGSLGIARQTLYRVLERRNIPLKSQVMGTDPVTGVPDDLTLAMSRQALTVLIEELVNARVRVAELEAENDGLRVLLDGHAKSVPRAARSSTGTKRR